MTPINNNQMSEELREKIRGIVESACWDAISDGEDRFTGVDEEVINELLTLISHERADAVKQCIKLIGTHTEHYGSYCDTGEDMEWACRSECVEMATKRLQEYLEVEEYLSNERGK